MRELAAEHMLAHGDDFAPFIDDAAIADDETDETPADAPLLERYCARVRSTRAWGGQLELRALATALNCVIAVHSAGQQPLRMGDGDAQIDVTYHRRALALGEHYNSVLQLANETNE